MDPAGAPRGAGWRLPRFTREEAFAYLASAAVVAVAGAVGWAMSAVATLPHVSVIFLCAVLTSAVRWGRGVALFAAALSVALASFFFYAPIYSFDVANPQDLLDLVVFSIAALLTSTLANEVRRRRIAAEQHDAVTTELYAFSRRLAGIVDAEELIRAIVESIARTVPCDAALALPNEGRTAVVTREGSEGVPSQALLTAATRLWRASGDRTSAAVEEEVSGWRLRLLRRGERSIAVIAVRNTATVAGRSELLDALADQAAVAIERAQLAAAIEDARVKAKTEELREALLNSVSHDLQTPLAAIIGSATSLQSFGALEDKEAEAELVATIREEGERLHHFIGNILDLTRIRAGEIHPRLEIVELADIVNAALRRAERALGGYDVTVDLPDDLPMLSLDLFLMEQTLVNLLENAVKYAPKGSRIEIKAALVGSHVAVEVRDHGIGIAGEDLPNVFDQFYRAEAQDAKRAGTGLGLSICRAFVEAHDGRIEAFSDGPGKGASFRVTLPVAKDTGDQFKLLDE